MSETIETVKVEREGLTLSRIIWRRFKRQVPGLVERVLDVNPGLSALGPTLPVGTVIEIPIPNVRQNPDVTPVRLW
jgi:phage tail protein X